MEVNGHSGVVHPYRGPGPTIQDYSFPDLGVTLVAAGPFASQIIGSVGWSATYMVLHPSIPVTVPSDWKKVTYGRIQMKVPPSWPIHQLGPSDMIPGSCGPEFQTPQVLEGEGGIVSGCPASLARVTAGIDSLWIHPAGSNPPAGTQPIRPSDPAVLVIPDTVAPQVQPVLHLLVKPAANEPYVAVDIGLGSQTATSQQILASLSNTPYLLPAIHSITG